jgi:hypothetical protein
MSTGTAIWRVFKWCVGIFVALVVLGVIVNW